MKLALFGKSMTGEKATFIEQLLNKMTDDGIAFTFYDRFWEEIRSFLYNTFEVDTFQNYDALMQQDVDFFLSIGGDGTMLDSITLVRDSGIPLLGINIGRLGFLSSVPQEMALLALDELKQGKYTNEKRTMLKVYTQSGVFGDMNYALNELTIHKSEAHSMLKVRVDVDGSYLNTYWADGLLIATPTGSTAYSMSCGGPILTPDASNFIITPIASHNLTVRPVVIPDDSEITLEVLGRSHHYYLGLDSRYVAMEKPEKIIIGKEKFKANFVKLQNEGFFDTIRKKLNWGLDNRN